MRSALAQIGWEIVGGGDLIPFRFLPSIPNSKVITKHQWLNMIMFEEGITTSPP